MESKPDLIPELNVCSLFEYINIAKPEILNQTWQENRLHVKIVKIQLETKQDKTLIK